jgi:hypothetical protein
MKLALQHLPASAWSDMKMTFQSEEKICSSVLKCAQTFEHTRQSFCETVIWLTNYSFTKRNQTSASKVSGTFLHDIQEATMFVLFCNLTTRTIPRTVTPQLLHYFTTVPICTSHCRHCSQPGAVVAQFLLQMAQPSTIHINIFSHYLCVKLCMCI